MAIKTQFINKLDKLWRQRTSALRMKIGLPAEGRGTNWSPRIRDHGRNQLLDLTTRLFLARADKEVQKVTRRKLWKRLTGRGHDERFARLGMWAHRISGPIIYTFWRGGRCLYVGKGGNADRLRHYSDSIKVSGADRVRVYIIRGKSQLPKAECLLIHRFRPAKNKQKAARQKWGKVCPICARHDYLKDQLKNLFD